jgi:chorismate lyase/3-hydroxybenzoate synthase
MNGLHLKACAPTGTPPDANTLGGAALGHAPGASAWPEQRLRMASEHPAGTAAWQEAWCVDGPLQQGSEDGLHWRGNRDTLYGVIELDEPAPTVTERGSHLRERTRQAYLKLFALLRARGTPHLWRVWNFMAGINAHEQGLERYRWFNLGRHDAFSAAGAPTERQVPAASAVGWAEGPLSIAFLAGRSAPRPIENPRQVSAFHYPPDYGPRPPVFARASLACSGANELLFVSGTASIVGHQTVHRGDVVAQCEESARNVRAVLDEVNRATRSAGHRAEALVHRAYVRQLADFPVVRQTLARCLGGASLTLMQADICRQDLLVEVESVGMARLGSE